MIDNDNLVVKTFYTLGRQHSALSGQKLPSKFIPVALEMACTGKKYFVLYLRWLWGGELFSSDIMWWLGDWNTTDPAPAPVASKEPEKGKNYFGLYLPVGGRKPIWNPI